MGGPAGCVQAPANSAPWRTAFIYQSIVCLGWPQIVDRMAARARGESTALLYAYSGHDTTIMPVLATLGVHLQDWPEYVSNVVSASATD